MKIRQGFVSNSSSSSFVVELPNPIEFYTMDTFKALIGQDNQYAEQLFKDLKTLTVDNFDIGDIYLELPDSMVGLVSDDIYCKFIKDIKKHIVSTFYKGYIPKNTYMVEYADDDGSYWSNMEHDFMPYLDITKKRISHH